MDIIAITDHNSTLHGPLTRRLAEPLGIMVLFGAEVTTREEAHCLCLFETEEQRQSFQSFIDANIPNIPNNPEKFGYQVVVNEDDEIIHEVDHYLHAALRVGVNELERAVHSLGGLFVPAHVDRGMFSLISQLGFIPNDLKFDALEISRQTSPNKFLENNAYLEKPCLIRNSDAHHPDQIGQVSTGYCMEQASLNEIAMSYREEHLREVLI